MLVTPPYVFANVASTLYNQHASLEQAARSLDASPLRAFVRVTLQLLDYLRWDFDPTAAAVSTVSILLTLAVVIVIDRTVGLRSLRFG